MKKILLSSGVLLFTIASLVVGGTGAFFSDTEISKANIFTAGAVDLKIDNTSYYNGIFNPMTSWQLKDLTLNEKFFDFGDLKPGDWGEDTISIHVDDNDAYVCAEITLTSNEENDCNEAELSDESNCESDTEGELAQNIYFVWWADDGDSVLEDNEEVISEGLIGNLSLNESYVVALADSQNNIWKNSPGPILGGEIKYIGKGWCFGNLVVKKEFQDGLGAGENNGPNIRRGGFTCDGSSLDNSTQTDSLTADIGFSAVQARHNSNFLCVPERPPVLHACSNPSVQKYADSVVFADQGKRQNGTDILADRTDPTKTLGAPQTSGNPSDVVTPGSFYSLGFGVNTTATRSLTVEFVDNVIKNDNGLAPDLRIYEVTGGTYPDEIAKVEASKDGINWVLLVPNANRDEDLDLGVLDWAKYVRITDLNVHTDPQWVIRPDADGYDVDAFEALNCGEFVNI